MSFILGSHSQNDGRIDFCSLKSPGGTVVLYYGSLRNLHRTLFCMESPQVLSYSEDTDAHPSSRAECPQRELVLASIAREQACDPCWPVRRSPWSSVYVLDRECLSPRHASHPGCWCHLCHGLGWKHSMEWIGTRKWVVSPSVSWDHCRCWAWTCKSLGFSGVGAQLPAPSSRTPLPERSLHTLTP